MLLTEVQTYSLTHLANAPFSSSVSVDHCFAFITEKGIDILRRAGKTGWLRWVVFLWLVSISAPVSADDATRQMFGDRTDGLPAAFGDFNSDEITDLFVIRDGGKTVEVLLGQDKEPVMHPAGIKCSFPNNYRITSVVPGDFNGDALMDVMVTLMVQGDAVFNHIVVLWGEMTHLNCTHKVLFKTVGQPLAMDYDKNMVIDLFGVDEDNNRAFWLFDSNSSNPMKKIPMNNNDTHDFNGKIRRPHSHAFLDLNDDDLADLYITTEDKFEIWTGNKDIPYGFTHWHTIDLPPGLNKNKQNVIGQTVFLDMELEGKLVHIVPVCDTMTCDNSRIFAYTQSDKQWHDLHVNFHEDGTANKWRFAVNTKPQKPYTETITLRAGDFNMDGYPDVMVTLNRADSQEYKSFFLKNVPCKTACSEFSRTFEIQWNVLSPYNNNTVLGVFFDFLQDGVLDLIFVQSQGTMFNVSAYRNTLDYDANFVKVMVVTGLTNAEHPLNPGPLRKSAGVYGTNLPGPKIMYQTTTQEGDPRSAVATQIPQSAHFTLNLPYTIFGLGRTPNFIDTLTVQVYGKYRQWTQLIPNSQMVVIPWPIEEPYSWKVQLFVTPSKLIFQSVLALLATCVLISLIIAGLYWKERKEDHLEKLQEAHRFHFDAM